jgi:hypothetical protein
MKRADVKAIKQTLARLPVDLKDILPISYLAWRRLFETSNQSEEA